MSFPGHLTRRALCSGLRDVQLLQECTVKIGSLECKDEQKISKNPFRAFKAGAFLKVSHHPAIIPGDPLLYRVAYAFVEETDGSNS